MTPNAKVRLGVVGVGYLGALHAARYAGMDPVELVGVVDIDRQRAAAVARECDTKPYPSLERLLDQIDAVSIAVPSASHFAIARQCLANRIDVLVEKPMTTSLADADALIALADRNQCILQVGHLERFNPAFLGLQHQIKDPLFIESHRLSLFQGRNTDVSVVLDLMIHDIDIIMNFVDADIQLIHAAGAPVICDQVDIANARLEFASGCVANVTASRVSLKNQRKLRLFQKDAYLSIDFAAREIMMIRQDPTPSQGPIPHMDIQQTSYSEQDALEQELEAFVASVVSRQGPAVTGEDGRRALAVALEISDQISDRYHRHFGQGFGCDLSQADR
jgi:predicted dehydrogenase